MNAAGDKGQTECEHASRVPPADRVGIVVEVVAVEGIEQFLDED